MKKRTGFVSNSSTSSFIVSVFDKHGKKRVITKAQEKALLGRQFVYVSHRSPSHISGPNLLNKSAEQATDQRYLGFWVVCNQDEEIDWLVEHRIPFTASCHYGHENVFFDGEELISLPNYGHMGETYGIQHVKELVPDAKKVMHITKTKKK
jgi:hypothetical protein